MRIIFRTVLFLGGKYICKNYLKEYQSSTKDKKLENEPLKLKIQTNSKNVFNAKFGKEFKDEDIL